MRRLLPNVAILPWPCTKLKLPLFLPLALCSTIATNHPPEDAILRNVTRAGLCQAPEHKQKAVVSKQLCEFFEPNDCHQFFEACLLHHDNAQTSAKLRDFVNCFSREGLWAGRYFNPAWLGEKLVSCEQMRSVSSPETFGTIKRLCDQRRLDEALWGVGTLQQKEAEVPSDVFYCVLQSCIKHKDIVAGRKLYCLVFRSGLETNTFLGIHLIRMFASCRSLSEADEVFSRLPKDNVFAWSAVIAAHSRCGQAMRAFELYNQMQALGVEPDEFIFASVIQVCAKLGRLDQGQLVNFSIIHGNFDWDAGVCNALIDMYMKCGGLQDARRVFDRMRQLTAKAITSLISGYTQNGYTWEVFEVFQRMLERGMEPDNFLLSSLLKACASGLCYLQGMLVYALVVERGFEGDAIIGSALMDMYVKCGSVRDACKVFSIMPETDHVPMWNTLTSGFALQNEDDLVLHFVKEMQQQVLKPDELGFACLLSACSRTGLVHKGCNLFHWMQKKHGVTPTVEHFTCIADLLGRAGHVTRAEDLLRSMPTPSDDVGWATIRHHFRRFGKHEERTIESGMTQQSLKWSSCMNIE